MQAFTIPSLNLQKIVGPGKTDSFTFTAPAKPGNIAFMCSMGMYVGTIRVI
jgi:heme/copper-type cytochrome/quinol oxidase subunit 2